MKIVGVKKIEVKIYLSLMQSVQAATASTREQAGSGR
jgi:hypothetical protein